VTRIMLNLTSWLSGAVVATSPRLLYPNASIASHDRRMTMPRARLIQIIDPHLGSMAAKPLEARKLLPRGA
jgi:hypothetical protein